MNKLRGFTLIELLAVIAVIVLLALVLSPALYRWQEEDPRSICMTNLRAMDQSCVLYASAHDDKYPVGWDPSGNPTPQDSFRLLVEEDLLPFRSLICPSVGGIAANNAAELVGLGGTYAGDPAAAAEAFIHYAYQDIDAARQSDRQRRNGENYLPGPHIAGGLPVFADRGQRTDPGNGDYELTGQGGANHPMKPPHQHWVGGAHGMQKALTEEVSVPGDNIYVDDPGQDDSYLLSSEQNAGPDPRAQQEP